MSRPRPVPVIALAAILLSLLGACGAKQAKQTVVIGADLSLSGDDRQVGQIYRNALQLAVSQYNASNDKQRIELRVRDDQSEPAIAMSQVTTFEADKKVSAIIIGPCDACVASIAPLARSSATPIISLAPADLPPADSGAGTALFKLAPNVTDDAAEMVTTMGAEKIHRLAIVAGSDAYGGEAAAAMTASASDGRITVTGTVDPSSVTKTTLHDADGVAIFAPPADADTALSNLHAAGFTGTVYLDAAAAAGLFLDGSVDFKATYLTFPGIMAADDMVAATPAQADQKRWFDNYTSQYGEYAGPSAFAADALQLIADAAQVAGTKQTKLRSVIETDQFDGLSGTIRFTPQNHSGLTARSLTMLQASDGRWHTTSVS